jgi:hypothetical protein
MKPAFFRGFIVGSLAGFILAGIFNSAAAYFIGLTIGFIGVLVMASRSTPKITGYAVECDEGDSFKFFVPNEDVKKIEGSFSQNGVKVQTPNESQQNLE